MRRVALGALLLALWGCAGRSGPEFPAPGWERGGVPRIDGAKVLVLPLQSVGEGRDGLDGELAYALRARAPGAEWAQASDVEATTAGAARLGADPGNLPVGVFDVGEVRRVGDPLFGEVYRLAAFVDADLVLLPLRGWWVAGAGEEGSARGAVHVHAALLAPRTGRVLWQGIVRGDEVSAGSPAADASAADRLARRLVG